MLKISDIFCVSSVPNKRKKAALLDQENKQPLLAAVGESADEATQKLLEKIRKVYRIPSWEPLLLERGGYRVIVYPTPDGWRNNMVYAKPDGITYEVSSSDLSLYPTRHDAERDARRHLAQLSWQFGEKESSVLLPDDKEGKCDFTRWVNFQEQFREALERGYNNDEAHCVAVGFIKQADELRAKREQAEAEKNQLTTHAETLALDSDVINLACLVKTELERYSFARTARHLAEELRCSKQKMEQALTLLEQSGWVECIAMDGEIRCSLIPKR